MLVVLPGTESRSHSDVIIPDGRTDIPLLWIEVFLERRITTLMPSLNANELPGPTRICAENMSLKVSILPVG